ncbi:MULTISPECIES: dihydrofolate reductase family protein [Fusobacterium]|jgi:dihydrofolate reductase|uniref:dihydrofolate reductase n=1 Tax=Fusobacterium hominis TaxID=2764326 RepID=A0A7G9GWW6_9FUSO|nr:MULTISPECIES: dihydrofolate reductase family protein [Fusobacterium]QNM15298.1 dihydrofolate reductase [Fusobacterium hominis]
MKVNLIVCVAKDNLIGDKNPEGNGLLWHSKEELLFYKEKTVGNVVLFGTNTAKYVPIKLMEKTRDVVVMSSKDKIEDVIKKYENTGKELFICGGATVYKYYLENYPLDKLYISKLKENVEVKEAKNPLYLPNVEEYGYKIVDQMEYNDFISYIYEKK